MKKIFRVFCLAMLFVLSSACADNLGNEVNVQDSALVTMTFSATMSDEVESKTTYSDRNVFWEETDAITVFSVGAESVGVTSFGEPELIENGAKARFTGLADASAETYYAVYPYSEANKYDAGTFSVTFPAEQTAVAGGFASGSNVSVAVSVKDAEVTEQSLLFKNAGALIAFSFPDLETALNTASVAFKAKKDDSGCGLAGATTFTLDDNNLPVAAKGSATEVVVNAPDDGFDVGVTYYIPVIPVGECTGMEVVYTDLNGDTYQKKNDTGFSLLRNCVFNVGTLPKPDLKIVFPEDFEIKLDFENNNWPFREPCQYVSESGEFYTYVHEFVLNDKTKRACFSLRMGGKPYSMTSNGLENTADNAFRMACPVVNDRYLTQFVAKSKKPLSLQSVWTNNSDGAKCLLSKNIADWGTRLTKFYSDYIIFYDDEQGELVLTRVDNGNTIECKFSTTIRSLFEPKVGKQYWLKFRWTGTLAYVTYTFSSSAPGEAPRAAE